MITKQLHLKPGRWNPRLRPGPTAPCGSQPAAFEGAFLGSILLPSGETITQHIERQKLLPSPAPADNVLRLAKKDRLYCGDAVKRLQECGQRAKEIVERKLGQPIGKREEVSEFLTKMRGGKHEEVSEFLTKMRGA